MMILIVWRSCNIYFTYTVYVIIVIIYRCHVISYIFQYALVDLFQADA